MHISRTRVAAFFRWGTHSDEILQIQEANKQEESIPFNSQLAGILPNIFTQKYEKFMSSLYLCE